MDKHWSHRLEEANGRSRPRLREIMNADKEKDDLKAEMSELKHQNKLLLDLVVSLIGTRT